MQTTDWLAPREKGRLVRSVSGQMMLTLQVKKVVFRDRCDLGGKGAS